MNNQLATTAPKKTLVGKFADKYSIEQDKLLTILKATAFRQKGNESVTNEQMAALLVVADQYGLNPFTKEIYAYPDKGGIVPVVGVDGWTRIINEHKEYDGIEFIYSGETVDHKSHKCHVWIECHIHRKDRTRPTIIREYFDEVVRTASFPTPWDTHPKRMHRHKTLIQCARVAFGFAGIYDDDEADRIMERNMGAADVVGTKPAGNAVPMPQARSKKTETAQDVIIENGAETGTTATQGDNHADIKETQTDSPAGHAGNSNLATAGEKKLVESQIAALELDFEDALNACGVNSFDKLTKDGFTALMDYIKERS